MLSDSLKVEVTSHVTIYSVKFEIYVKSGSLQKGKHGPVMGRRMDAKQLAEEDKELVLVAFEGGIANLEMLVGLARECGFRKVLSVLVKDLQKAQAEMVEIIAMAANDELRERVQAD
jgi:hypothetical protein